MHRQYIQYQSCHDVYCVCRFDDVDAETKLPVSVLLWSVLCVQVWWCWHRDNTFRICLAMMYTVCVGLMMLTQRQYIQNLSYHDVYCLCTFDDVCTETIGLLPVLPWCILFVQVWRRSHKDTISNTCLTLNYTAYTGLVEVTQRQYNQYLFHLCAGFEEVTER